MEYDDRGDNFPFDVEPNGIDAYIYIYIYFNILKLKY